MLSQCPKYHIKQKTFENQKMNNAHDVSEIPLSTKIRLSKKRGRKEGRGRMRIVKISLEAGKITSYSTGQ